MVGRVTHLQDPMPGEKTVKNIQQKNNRMFISVAAAVPASGSNLTRSPPLLTGATFTAPTPSRRRGSERGPGAGSEKIIRCHDDMMIMKNNDEYL